MPSEFCCEPEDALKNSLFFKKETLKILTIGKLIMIRNVHIHLCIFVSPFSTPENFPKGSVPGGEKKKENPLDRMVCSVWIRIGICWLDLGRC